MITLTSGPLRVEIAEPGEHPNDGVRFDRAGFITEVVLNNERHFCANEPKNLSHPSSGGRGLCCEMKLDLSGQAELGGRYPKFGVGLIRKDTEERYRFFEKYDVAPFPVRFRAAETAAEFETEPLPCLGYALRQRKRVSVEGNRLTVEHTLENAGEKIIDMVEYCHNFLSVDGMAVSPDYVLETPGLRDYGNGPLRGHDGKDLNLIGHGRGFTFARADVSVALADVDISGASGELPFRWTLSHRGAKARVEAEDGYTPAGLTIWAADHMVSPENMHHIVLAPGETVSWTRRLTFVDEIYP